MATKHPRTIKTQTRDGQIFFIEVNGGDDGPNVVTARSHVDVAVADPSLFHGGEEQGASDRILEKASMFSKAVDIIKSVSQDVSSSLLETRPRPSEVELSLDLGFDAGGSVWIVQGSAKASMRLHLKWTLTDKKDG